MILQILFIKHWHIDQKAAVWKGWLNKTRKQAEFLGVKNCTFEKEPSATIPSDNVLGTYVGGWGDLCIKGELICG